MSRACGAPLALDLLVEYWLGELDEAREHVVEEHLLGCGTCAANLDSLVALTEGMRAAVRRGAVRAVASGALVERLAAGGVRLREYRVPCNGSVYCTVAPDDDVVVSRLQAPLDDVDRLDVVVLDAQGGERERVPDVPFDRAAGEVVLLPRIDPIKALGPATERMRLVALGRGGERTIGEYTFVHTPWPGRRGSA